MLPKDEHCLSMSHALQLGWDRAREIPHPAGKGRLAFGMAGTAQGFPTMFLLSSLQGRGQIPFCSGSRASIRPGGPRSDWGSSPTQCWLSLYTYSVTCLRLLWSGETESREGREREHQQLQEFLLSWLRLPCVYISHQPPPLVSPQLGGDTANRRMKGSGTPAAQRRVASSFWGSADPQSCWCSTPHRALPAPALPSVLCATAAAEHKSLGPEVQRELLCAHL